MDGSVDDTGKVLEKRGLAWISRLNGYARVVAVRR